MSSRSICLPHGNPMQADKILKTFDRKIVKALIMINKAFMLVCNYKV